MNGPKHYRLAEDCWARGDDGTLNVQQQAVVYAAAQVHATLALAAATWDAACLARSTTTGIKPPQLNTDAAAWDEATS